MTDWLAQSAFFGVFISLAAYEVGAVLKKKLGFSILNPLLISVCLVMLALPFLHVKYEVYAEGAQYLSYLLTPATVCLAVPLYRQLELLKRHWKAVLLGIGAGTLASMLGVLVLSALFGLSHSQYVTLLPKSITTAIGMGLSEEMGGAVTITVAVIIVTGIFGNIIAELVCKAARLEEPVAKGLALGTSAHAIGTAKAMEMGEVEGAMSGLAIAVCGLMTVVVSFAFAGLL